jgi:hypothetical protein
MLRKPFEVWFSLALAILALSTWSGWKLGERIAVHWYHHQQQKLGAEQGRFESMLSVLDGLETTEIFASALAASSGKELQLGKYLRAEITELERLKGRPDYGEIKTILEMQLGLAHVNAAMAEEQSGHKDLADSDIKSAQALFQSLGWKDYSTDALRIAAKRELDGWNPQARTKDHGK